MSASTLPLAPDQYSGRKLGKYEIICRLSTGGMSVIFLAFQRGLGGFRKFVVLKQILPDIKGEEEFVRMFLDEARITAAFSHSNIAQVYDLDIQEGELFLAMEFVPGATLVEVAKACRSAGEPIPTGFTLMAVRDVAQALHYAHTFTDPLGRQQTVIHRDVAEKNIMVTYDGTMKLLDFGIAKSLAHMGRTTIGMVKGTSGYMSPEQILGEKLDARSDVFSLGVVLHECLTGMRLFHGKSPEDGMLAALKESVAPPSRGNSEVTPELDAVVMKALARQREDRYSNARELARAIERTAGELMWQPEQAAELIERLFKDRRTQTQRLMANSASEREVTGEHLLRKLLGESERPHLRQVPTPPPMVAPKPGPKAGSTVIPITAALPKPPPPVEDTPSAGTESLRNAPTPTDRERTVKPKKAPVKRVGRNHDYDSPPPPMQTPRPGGSVLDPEALTVPVGSVPPEVLAGLDMAPSRPSTPVRVPPITAVPSGASMGAPTLNEEAFTSPGTVVSKLRSQKAAAALFVSLMIAVFGVGMWLSKMHRANKAARAQEEQVRQEQEKEKERLRQEEAALKAQQEKPEAAREDTSETASEKSADEPTEKPPEKLLEKPTEKASDRAAVVRQVEKTREEPRRVEVQRAAKPAAPPKPKPTKTLLAKAEPAPKEPTRSSALGYLTLQAKPWAKVYFKSQLLETTPFFKQPLPAGRHVLKLEGQDGVRRLLNVEIREGETLKLAPSLSELPEEP